MQGLGAGRSFVSTGPMLFVDYNGRPPGHTFKMDQMENRCRVQGTAESAAPLVRIEIVVNGEIVRTIQPQNQATKQGGYSSPLDESLTLSGSSWVAVRAIETRPSGSIRFAHSSPAHFDVPGRPLRPRKAEVAWLVRRMEQELDRNRGLLTDTALDEYRQALETYRNLEAGAR
jgi:hypothetical protein